jgi:glycosyltransferase involved in cell wall biosynthesis
MKFILHYGNNPPFVLGDHEAKGLGGTENFAVYVAKNLVAQGHQVKFYNKAAIEPRELMPGLIWANLDHFNPAEEADFLISFRMREVFQQNPNVKKKILILADTESVGLGYDVKTDKIDIVMAVSKWQLDKIAAEEGLVGHSCWMLGSNGIDMAEFAGNGVEKTPGLCIHLSTPERGLGPLLDVWGAIQDSSFLSARGIKPELHLFSSFFGWGVTPEENDNMCREVYDRIREMSRQGCRIYNHIHAERDELRKWQLQADVMLYPTNFLETYCISLTECMAAGVIPVVSNKAAMGERVLHQVNGWAVGDATTDINTDAAKIAFAENAIAALWTDPAHKDKIREAARAAAAQYDYVKLVEKWIRQWEARL